MLLYVQCALLPGSTDGKRILGVKLATAIAPGDGGDAPRQEDLEQWLVPWLWNWKQMEPDGWRVYQRIADTTAAGAPGAVPSRWEPVGSVTALDPGELDNAEKLRQAVLSRTRTIAAPGGAFLPETLLAPGVQNGSDPAARPKRQPRECVRGLLEQMGTLPAPLPQTLGLWTCLLLDTAETNAAQSLIAFPAFYPNSPHIPELVFMPGTPTAVEGANDVWSVSYTLSGAAPGTPASPPPAAGAPPVTPAPAPAATPPGEPPRALALAANVDGNTPPGLIEDMWLAIGSSANCYGEAWGAGLIDRFAEIFDPLGLLRSANCPFTDQDSPERFSAIQKIWVEVFGTGIVSGRGLAPAALSLLRGVDQDAGQEPRPEAALGETLLWNLAAWECREDKPAPDKETIHKTFSDVNLAEALVDWWLKAVGPHATGKVTPFAWRIEETGTASAKAQTLHGLIDLTAGLYWEGTFAVTGSFTADKPFTLALHDAPLAVNAMPGRLENGPDTYRLTLTVDTKNRKTVLQWQEAPLPDSAFPTDAPAMVDKLLLRLVLTPKEKQPNAYDLAVTPGLSGDNPRKVTWLQEQKTTLPEWFGSDAVGLLLCPSDTYKAEVLSASRSTIPPPKKNDTHETSIVAAALAALLNQRLPSLGQRGLFVANHAGRHWEETLKKAHEEIISGSSMENAFERAAFDVLKQYFKNNTLEKLWGLAGPIATRLARAKVVPQPLSDQTRPSLTALPLVIPVDQLDGSFPHAIPWERYAGFGAMVARSASETLNGNEPWYSLNAATVTVGNAPDSFEADLDPVPCQVAELGGARQAFLTYDERGLIGRMPHEAAPTGSSAPFVRYARKVSMKLPALIFGYWYHFAAYVISHGGGLPNELRVHENTPTKARFLPNARLDGTIDLPNNAVLTARYLRTVQVGAPRLDSRKYDNTVPQALPQVPEGVFPLAAELPPAPPRLWLYKVEDAVTCCRPLKGSGGSITLLSKDSLRIDLEALSGLADTAWLDLKLCDGELSSQTIRIAGANAEISSEKLICEVRLGPSDGQPRDVRIFWKEPKSTDSSWAAYSLTYEDPAREGAPRKKNLACTSGDVSLNDWSHAWLEVSYGGPDGTEGPLSFRPPAIRVNGQEAQCPRRQWDTSGIIVLHNLPQSAHKANTAAFRLRPPAVELRTWQRWLAAGINGPDPRVFQQRAQAAFKANLMATDTDHYTDPSLDDPAVDVFFVELVALFPPKGIAAAQTPPVWATGFRNRAQPQSDKPLADLPDAHDQKQGPVVEIDIDTLASLKYEDGRVKVTVPEGGVYALRFHGGVRKEHVAGYSEHAQNVRMIRNAMAGARMASYEDTAFVLGPPLTILVEVATASLPQIDIPAKTTRAAHVTSGGTQLDDRVVVWLTGKTEELPLYRYVRRMRLQTQRWGWRGRPLPPLPDMAEEAATPQGPLPMEVRVDPEDSNPLDYAFEAKEDWAGWEKIAFLQRRPDDIGPELERILRVPHIYPDDDDKVEALFRKDLDYRGPANYWRLRLVAESRYLPLAPDNDSLTAATGVTRTTSNTATAPSWLSLLVRSRDTGRKIARPAVELALPLTEAIEPVANRTAPPIMVVCNEASHIHGNVAEALLAEVELALHPLPTDSPGYWPEYGPDPILTERARAKGRPMPVKLDGPFGWTFDEGVEAGRYGKSCVLVSLASNEQEAQDDTPWSFAKLRFCRMEDPKVSRRSDQACVKEWWENSGHSAIAFLEGYEGVALEFKGNTFPDSGWSITLFDSQDATANITVQCTLEGSSRTLYAKAYVPGKNTEAGTGVYAFPSERLSAGVLRLLIVPTGTVWPVRDEAARPSWAVHIQLRSHRSEAADAHCESTAWAGLYSLTLTSSKPFPKKPEKQDRHAYPSLGIKAENYNLAGVQPWPLRISPFTDAVWHQFGEDFSRYRITQEGYAEVILSNVNALRAVLRTDGSTNVLCQLQARQDSPANLNVVYRNVTGCAPCIPPATASAPGGDAMTAPVSTPVILLVVVCTHWVSDAFGQPKEEFFQAWKVETGGRLTLLDAQPATVAARLAGIPDGASFGRARILQIMLNKNRSGEEFTMISQIFALDEGTKSKDDNGIRERDDAFENDSLDALSRALGVSHPMELVVHRGA
jgi:hypothetical protein